MQHDGNSFYAWRHVSGETDCISHLNATHRVREHKADSIGATIHCCRDCGSIGQTAYFYERRHAATLSRPALNISPINPAGSSARISAVPTSAIS
jgi:hypothetical protein